MITINEKWSYYANFVKFPKDRFTSFSIGVKDVETGEYVNYQIFCFEKYENLQDGDKVRITKIHSTELAFYKDKPQLKVTCDIEILEKESANESNYANEISQDEPVLDIIDSDLPF